MIRDLPGPPSHPSLDANSTNQQEFCCTQLGQSPKPLTFQTTVALSCFCSRSRNLLPVFWADFWASPAEDFANATFPLMLNGEIAVTSLLPGDLCDLSPIKSYWHFFPSPASDSERLPAAGGLRAVSGDRRHEFRSVLVLAVCNMGKSPNFCCPSFLIRKIKVIRGQTSESCEWMKTS